MGQCDMDDCSFTPLGNDSPAAAAAASEFGLILAAALEDRLAYCPVTF